jgi:hypothetical protein
MSVRHPYTAPKTVTVGLPGGGDHWVRNRFIDASLEVKPVPDDDAMWLVEDFGGDDAEA